MAVMGWLENAAKMQEGFLIPQEAVLQEGPDLVVFIRTGPELFTKIPIEVGPEIDSRILVTHGLSATNRVAISGAHQILSMTRAEPAE